jgi:hypothetical protein
MNFAVALADSAASFQPSKATIRVLPAKMFTFSLGFSTISYLKP